MPNQTLRNVNSTTKGSRSIADTPHGSATVHTRNNTSGCKRKSKSINNDSAPITNDIKIQRQHDRPSHIRQRTTTVLEDDAPQPPSITSDISPFEDISPASIILKLDSDTLCKLAYEKLNWVDGNGQCHILPVQRALIKYYNGEGNGVDNLRADIAVINYNEGFSSDSDTDDEVEEVDKSSVAAADAAEEDDGDVSFDNDGGDESTNGTTDELGESSTSTPADVTLHDSAAQSSTTSTLKVDISCVGNRVEENRDDPSPINATADLSRFTNDASPAPDSNNVSYDEDEEHDVLNFDVRPIECIGGSDGVVSPKKVNAKKSVLISERGQNQYYPPQHFGYTPLPPQNQYYPYWGHQPNPAQHVPTITFRARKQTIKSKVGVGFDNKNKIICIAPFSIFIGSGLVVGCVLRSINSIKLLSSDHALSLFANAKGVVSVEVSPPLPVVTNAPNGYYYSTAQHYPNQGTQWGMQYYPPNYSNAGYPAVPLEAKQDRLTAAKAKLQQLEATRARLHQIEQSSELESLKFRSALQLQQQLLAQEETREEEKRKKRTVKWLLQCMYTSDVDSTARTWSWDGDEEERLIFGIHLFGFGEWKSIQLIVLTRTSDQIGKKANSQYRSDIRIDLRGTIGAIDTLFTREDVEEFHDQTLSTVESILERLQWKSVIQVHQSLRKSLRCGLRRTPRRKGNGKQASD